MQNYSITMEITKKQVGCYVSRLLFLPHETDQRMRTDTAVGGAVAMGRLGLRGRHELTKFRQIVDFSWRYPIDEKRLSYNDPGLLCVVVTITV